MSNLVRYRMTQGDSINMPKMLKCETGAWVKFDDIKEFLNPTANNGYMAALAKIMKIIRGRGDTVTKVGKVSDVMASLNFPKAENCT